MAKPKPLGRPNPNLPIYNPEAADEVLSYDPLSRGAEHSGERGYWDDPARSGRETLEREQRFMDRINSRLNELESNNPDIDENERHYRRVRRQARSEALQSNAQRIAELEDELYGDNPPDRYANNPSRRPRFTDEQLRWAEEAADPDFEERVERGRSNLRRAEAASRRANERFHAGLNEAGRSRYNRDVQAVRDSIRARHAVRSNTLLSKARTAVNRGVEAGFDAISSTRAGQAVGRATTAFGRTAVGRVAGAIATKTAVPLMYADAAYNIANVAHEGYKVAKAKNEARTNEAYMDKHYGTIEAATRTRHARNKKK